MSRKQKIVAIVVGILVLIWFGLMLGISIASCVGKARAEREWSKKFPSKKRNPAEIRSLVENMVKHREQNVPAFIPQYMWRGEYCAANVINGVNMILGEKRLQMSSAWEFSQVNKKHLRKVYDRSQDFAVKGKRIIEQRDSNFWLSKVLETTGRGKSLTSDRIYIVGYHYGRTTSDEKIIAAKKDINSHLMIILGRYDGRWWGYHFYHDPEKSNANPFSIDDLGDHQNKKVIPDSFDVVYIWEVLNSRMTRKGMSANLAFMQMSPDYRKIKKHLWFEKGRLGQWWNRGMNTIFGSGDHFPRVVNLDKEIVKVRENNSHFGRILGFYQGVSIRLHRGRSRRGDFGLRYQCVEFVNRFYALKLGHRNMSKTGHADSYYQNAEAKGLKAFANGATEKPKIHDILVFDSSRRGDPGHVAIIYKVTPDRVCFVQQNMLPWKKCLRLSSKKGRYTVSRLSRNRPVIGWSRKI